MCEYRGAQQPLLEFLEGLLHGGRDFKLLIVLEVALLQLFQKWIGYCCEVTDEPTVVGDLQLRPGLDLLVLFLSILTFPKNPLRAFFVLGIGHDCTTSTYSFVGDNPCSLTLKPK